LQSRHQLSSGFVASRLQPPGQANRWVDSPSGSEPLRFRPSRGGSYERSAERSSLVS